MNRLMWLLLFLVGCGFDSKQAEQEAAGPVNTGEDSPVGKAAPAPAQNPPPQPASKTADGEEGSPVDPKMQAIYSALKITDAHANAESFAVGDEVTITYNITNVTSNDLSIPIKTSYSKPRHVAGTMQCYIERQGSDSTIPAIPKRIRRKGNKYPAGGYAIFTEAVFAAGEKFSFKNKVDTAGYPAGKYTFDIRYLQKGGVVNETVSIEFELQEATDQ
ncbi:MAG: hypothetical protein ABGZ17_05075 [Planctomycetaceae bacterium]